MKAITFSLETLQPLLATSFQGDPNSDVSYSYIPGSMIRGALIGRFMKQHNIRDLDEMTDAETVRRLFFNANSTRYLNAYLASGSKQRSLPVSRSWFKDKDEDLEGSSEIIVYDFSHERDDDLETPKLLGEGFWCDEGGKIKFYHEERRITVHHWRDRRRGRATPEQGDIFRYDALSAGQIFRGVILCESDDDATKLQELLKKSEDLWLGGSQSAGYGHTKVCVDLNSDADWREIKISSAERLKQEGFTVTLLSDALLKDNNGQSVADAKLIKLAIERLLNISLPRIRCGGIFAGSSLVGGFNRKWGLPLPQLPAVAAGSVVVFNADECPLSLEQVQQLEKQGVGDRREDGFGRIAVNLLEKSRFYLSKPESVSSTEEPLQENSIEIATFMAERLIRQKLEQLLLEQVSRYKITNLDKVSNRQLSRLGIVVRQGLKQQTLKPVQELLEEENLTQKARNQFSDAKINNVSLNSKLQSWLTDPRSWISNPQNFEIKFTSQFKQELTGEVGDRLITEYTLKLIMAIVKQAIKEKPNDE